MRRQSRGPEPEVTYAIRSSRPVTSSTLATPSAPALPDESEATWFCTFPSQPQFLLIRVPKGAALPALPALRTPFRQELVGTELGDAGLVRPLVRVAEGSLVHWGPAFAALEHKARAERTGRCRERTLAQARVLRGAADPAERDRGALTERQVVLDDKIRSLKASVASASGARGPMTEGILRKLRMDLADAQREVTEVNARLRELNAVERARQRAETRTFERAFVDAAEARLDRELFHELLHAAREAVVGDDEDGEDGES